MNLIVSRQPGSPDNQTSYEVLQSTTKANRPTAEKDSSSSSDVDDEDGYAALNNPITPGEETEILIDKGSTGLGLSIVGGADTLLVSSQISLDSRVAHFVSFWLNSRILFVVLVPVTRLNILP